MNGRYQARLVSTPLGARLAGPSAVGRVHSVFRGALNLELGGDLVTLAGPSVGALPNGMVLEADVDFSDLGLVAGMAVEGVRDGGALSVDGGRLVVDLRAASAWSPRLARGTLRARHLDQVTQHLATALARAPATGGFAPLLGLLAHGVAWPIDGLPRTCATAYPAIKRLLAGARAGNLHVALDGARGLIGLGEGLTPSGDDLLVGFSAGLRAVASPLDPGLARACAQLASGRTTRVAEVFLAHAARGEYSARIHRLVHVLSVGSARVPSAVGVVRAASAEATAGGAVSLADELSLALRWGASSGADTLLGVLLGGGMRT